MVEAFDELYQGYHQCPAEVLDRTFGETAGVVVIQAVRGDRDLANLWDNKHGELNVTDAAGFMASVA